ncbi:MAG: hypothetical protein WCG50_04610 [Rhodoferax sp.]|uniref:hypothetical protein n=1 Tax=Rhodoferax sp. TaxID=50421 RepID=UPI00301955C8
MKNLANQSHSDADVEMRLPDSDQSITYVGTMVHWRRKQNDTPLGVEIPAANLQEPFTTGKEPALDESLFADDAHSPRETHH